MSDEVEVEELRPSEVQESKKFICDFIEIYQAHPCLWKYSNKDYRNKNVKDKAYNALVDKMREIDPRADKNSVMRKINALRTGFRREYKKVRKAVTFVKNSGVKQSKYTPSLWYYDSLKFVVEQQDFSDPPPGMSANYWLEEPPTESFASVDCDGKIVNHNAENLMEFLEDTTIIPDANVKIEQPSPPSSRPATPSIPATPATGTSGPAMNLEIDAVYSETINGPATTTTTNRTIIPVLSARREEIFNSSEPPPLAPIWKGKRPPSMITATTSDPEHADLDRFGLYVVSKLKRSSRTQTIIAEKVIAEVLMRANLGTLEETTVLTDPKTTT